MNLPNILTIIRILLTPLFVFFFFSNNPLLKLLSLIIFIIAALTDYYDGYLARKQGIVTNFGKYVDPLADKILTLSAFISFAVKGYVFTWMVVVIIIRECVITALRSITMYQGKLINTSKMGKWKTVTQIVSIIVVLLYAVIESYLSLPIITISQFFIHTCMLIAVIFTLISGFLYFSRNYQTLRGVFS